MMIEKTEKRRQMAYTNTSSVTHTPSITRLGEAVAELRARYKTYRLYRDTLDGLSALSNRELDDLGLSRSELRRVAEEAAYK